MVLSWILANWSTILPVLSFLWSEYLGWKSGGEKASISQILWDLITKLPGLLKK